MRRLNVFERDVLDRVTSRWSLSPAERQQVATYLRGERRCMDIDAITNSTVRQAIDDHERDLPMYIVQHMANSGSLVLLNQSRAALARKFNLTETQTSRLIRYTAEASHD